MPLPSLASPHNCNRIHPNGQLGSVGSVAYLRSESRLNKFQFSCALKQTVSPEWALAENGNIRSLGSLHKQLPADLYSLRDICNWADANVLLNAGALGTFDFGNCCGNYDD